MILRRLAWAAGALVLTTSLVCAQSTLGSIAGEVKGEDGLPLKGAVIKIVRKDIKGNYNTKTGKKGDYYYGGLQLGQYDVTCEVNGKVVETVSNVKTRLGDPMQVNFNLAEKKKREQDLQKAAESGQLTAEMARQMSPEQKAQLEKQAKERQKVMEKNKALNDAFNAGMTALTAKQYPEAVEAFKKAGELDPNQHVVWAHLGECYISMSQAAQPADKEGLIAQGLESWGKALALAPQDPGYHNNFALSLARANKFTEAQEELQKAADLDPANGGKYYYNLGALLVNSGKSDPAVEAFKKAIALTPDYAEAHYQYGIALLGKMTVKADGTPVYPDGTKEEFEKYLELAPNGTNAASAKAMLETLGAKVETTYQDPNAKKAPAPKKATTKKK